MKILGTIIAGVLGILIGGAAAVVTAFVLYAILALIGAPVVLVTWNLGVVAAVSAFGGSVATIGFWQAFGIGLVLMALRTVFSSKGNDGQALTEAIEKHQQSKKQKQVESLSEVLKYTRTPESGEFLPPRPPRRSH